MEHNELKPCPFCGGDAKIMNYIRNTLPLSLCACVRCKNCSCTSKEFSQMRSENDIAYIFKAVAEWNRRTNDGT